MEKFLADESVDFQIVMHMRTSGYVVRAISEIDPGIDDEVVLRMANESSATKIFSNLSYTPPEVGAYL